MLTSLEGFNVIMNFLVLPMFFLSGALYPIKALPSFLQYTTYINPLSYGIDSFKHIILQGAGPPMGADLPFLLDIAVVTLFSVVMVILTGLSFAKRA